MDMNTQQLKDTLDAAIQTLSDDLSEGRSETLTRHLKQIVNLHRYSLTNMMLIECQASGTRGAAAKSAWEAAGRTLKPDARPINIWVPGPGIRNRERNSDQKDGGSGEFQTEQETGTEAVQAKRRCTARFLTSVIYAIEDTEGPEHTSLVPGDDLELLHAVADCSPLELDIRTSPVGARSTLRGHTLEVDLGACEMLNELTADLIRHWIDTDFKNEGTLGGMTPEESSALYAAETEMSTYVVLHALGVDATLPETVTGLYDRRLRRLKKSLDRVHKQSQSVLALLAPVLSRWAS